MSMEDDFPDELESVRKLIKFIGDDPDREGLKDTPKRVLTAWQDEWALGNWCDDSEYDILKTFDAVAEPKQTTLDIADPTGLGRRLLLSEQKAIHPKYNEMIIQHGIRVYSHCEHHLAPFWGTASIAYVPTWKGIVGLSKLSRLVNLFARRLQVQERLTIEIADALEKHLSAHVAIRIEAAHMCMISRGVSQSDATTTTTALRGNFFSEPQVRAEFLGDCRSAKG